VFSRTPQSAKTRMSENVVALPVEKLEDSATKMVQFVGLARYQQINFPEALASPLRVR
jgi:hypothetical protein